MPAGTLTDLDTATDASQQTLSLNNSFAAAQPIFNPAVVGGYVSDRPGFYVVTASDGQAWNQLFPQDAVDVFKVRLFAGQTLQLEVHDADHELLTASGEPNQDGERPLLALQLFPADATDTEVAATAVGGDPEQASSVATLTVPETGDYFIQVSATPNSSAYQGGPANYILRVEQTALLGGALSVTDDFVPGEVLMEWEDNAQPSTMRRSSANLTPLSNLTPVPNMASPQDGGGAQLMRIDHPAFANTARSGSVVASASQVAEQKRVTVETIRQLRRQPGVRFAEPNYIRRALAVPSDPLYARQWHHELINLPTAWNSSQGEDVVVAVIDSGVLLEHPDLAGQLTAGYDFVSDAKIALDGDGYDEDPSDPGDEETGGSSFHGTHVAGIVAALAGNGRGGVGTAYGAKVMPLRVLGRGGEGRDFDVAQAVRYAAGLSNASGRLPERRADVINLSLGSPSYSQTLRTAVDAATQAGVIVVAAAGNENTSSPVYPAAYDSAFSVSAVGPDKRRAPYSNFGTTIDLAAAGGNFLLDVDNDGRGDGVLSTWGDDRYGVPRPGYAWMEGTSMATPQVAGVVALMKAVRPSLSVAEFRQFLDVGKLTQAIGDPAYYGKGLIDASKAVSTALAGEPTPILVAYPGSLVFEGLAESADLTLDNGGSDVQPLTLMGGQPVVEDGGRGWLTLTPVAVDGDGLGRYRVSVDRSAFVEGVSYSGRIIAQSNFGQVEVPVVARAPDREGLANAGTQFLILVDAETDEPVRGETLGPAKDGAYQFSLEDVPPGRYRLFTGTDQDNDGIICDGGEACGSYPPGQQQVLRVPEDTGQELLFNTGFSTSIETSRAAIMDAPRSESGAGIGVSRLIP